LFNFTYVSTDFNHKKLNILKKLAKKLNSPPIPVHVIIDANPCPDLLARLTVKYLFINQLQGFATTQRTILEHPLQNLDLLANRRLTRSTKAWRAVEVQANSNKEEI
jgi:hypothetical protein